MPKRGGGGRIYLGGGISRAVGGSRSHSGGGGGRSHSGGGGGRSRSGGGGYRPSYHSYTPPSAYEQTTMDALQANIAKRVAADAARLGLPYGGHPLQQQRPDLKYETVETRWSERAQYGQDQIADRYRQQHELADNIGGQISDAMKKANGN